MPHDFMFVVISALLAVSAPAQAAEDKKTPKDDPNRVVCVPLRDDHNRPTSDRACKTVAQWTVILRKNDMSHVTTQTDFFAAPNSYYGGGQH